MSLKSLKTTQRPMHVMMGQLLVIKLGEICMLEDFNAILAMNY